MKTKNLLGMETILFLQGDVRKTSVKSHKRVCTSIYELTKLILKFIILQVHNTTTL